MPVHLVLVATGFFLFAIISSVSRGNTPTIDVVRDQFDGGAYASAVGILRTLLAQSPNDSRLYYWLGRCAYEQRDFPHAADHFHRAVDLGPQVAIFHQWLGRAYSENAERGHSLALARKAKVEYGAAVQLDPANLSARRDLEEYDIDSPWIAGGNKDEALAQAEAIAARDPVEGHLARAYYFLHAANQPANADAEFLQILKEKPQRIAPYLEAARHFQHDKKPAELEAFIQAAMAVDPTDARLDYFHAALLFLKRGPAPTAEAFLTRYIAATPDRSDWPSHADAKELLGAAYEMEGKLAEAVAQYRAALQIDPHLRVAREGLRRLDKSAQ